MDEMERRAFVLEDLELRADEGAAPALSGYAAVFNSRSENLGGFVEQIAPGAFAETLRTADVRLLLNHDGLPLARTKSGTLTLSEDARGLKFAADLEPADPDVQRLVPKMRRGDLNQMSFAFQTEIDEWDWSAKPPVRTLKQVRLFEVSVVTFPAYARTSAKVRSLVADAERTAETDAETALAAAVAMRRRRLQLAERSAR